MLIQKSQYHWQTNDMININFAKGHLGEARMSQLISLVWLSGWKSHKLGLLCRFPLCLGFDSVRNITGLVLSFFFFSCGIDFLPSLWKLSSERIKQTKQRTWKGKQEGNFTNDLRAPRGSDLTLTALAGVAFRPTTASQVSSHHFTFHSVRLQHTHSCNTGATGFCFV